MERGDANFINFQGGYNFFHNLTVQQKIRCIMDMVEGLTQMHYHGITHNDITIRNAIVTKDKRFKFIDFDVARICPIRLSSYVSSKEKEQEKLRFR